MKWKVKGKEETKKTRKQKKDGLGCFLLSCWCKLTNLLPLLFPPWFCFSCSCSQTTSVSTARAFLPYPPSSFLSHSKSVSSFLLLLLLSSPPRRRHPLLLLLSRRVFFPAAAKAFQTVTFL